MSAMMVVQLKAADVCHDGVFVKIGRVARAIALAMNKGKKKQTYAELTAVERELFPLVNFAVQLDKLFPLSPRGLRPLSKQEWGNGIVNFDKLVEWGRLEGFDFKTPIPKARKHRAQVVSSFIPPEGEALKRAEKIKHDEGRITINEAIVTLNRETGEFINIEQAVRDGQIKSYAPGHRTQIESPRAGTDQREELYPDELDKWLDANCDRVKFRFPKVGAGGTAKETPDERQARLQKHCDKLKADNVKAWKKQAAAEEKISGAMLDKILRRNKVSKSPKPGTIEGLKGFKRT